MDCVLRGRRRSVNGVVHRLLGVGRRAACGDGGGLREGRELGGGCAQRGEEDEARGDLDHDYGIKIYACVRM